MKKCRSNVLSHPDWANKKCCSAFIMVTFKNGYRDAGGDWYELNE